MKVALVHEWLESYAGSERVFEQLIACWPDADLFALCDFMRPDRRGWLGGRPVTTSFIQRLPFARRRFRNYLPLMPIAIEQLDLAGYDLVISSSHAVAKGVLTGPGQLHVSYVHSPMRYAWDLQHQYLRESGLGRGLRGVLTRALLHRLRGWDVISAGRPDVLVANSRYIAARIAKTWRRESSVIHPPVDLASFPLRTDKQDYFLTASRLVPYKRVELVVEAFRALPEHRLVVVGDGPSAARVRAAAAGAPNIELRGHLPHAELVALVGAARAMVLAAEEDFGIATVEAQAAGTPVIAFGRGGAADIVIAPPAPRPTGLLFAEQSVAAIAAAVRAFDALAPAIAPADCAANAARFSQAAFRTAITGLVNQHLASPPCASR